MTDKPKTRAVIPFGKHKGTPIEVLQETDPKYLEWLSEQDWFRQKYANFYQVIVNHGTEPSETPEHNALQLRFLDLEFKRAAWMLTCDTDSVPPQIHSTFEHDGIDVLLTADNHHAAIELKPSMGDDYPAVVRQVRAYRQIVKRRSGDPDASLAIVVGSFQSQVATLDQLRKLFSDVTFATVEEIESFRVNVPHGIAQRKYDDTVTRHSWLEHMRRFLEQNTHIDDPFRGPHLSVSGDDFSAISEALEACGKQPSGINEHKEWRAKRRLVLEQIVAEQLAMAHGAMVRAKEALAALGGET